MSKALAFAFINTTLLHCNTWLSAATFYLSPLPVVANANTSGLSYFGPKFAENEVYILYDTTKINTETKIEILNVF